MSDVKTKAAFTPGPWTVDDGGIRCDHKHNYGIVAQVHEGRIYSEYTSDSPTLEFENVADMHLVAAAPDLYETLAVIVANAALIPDPATGESTDCYAVPIDDIEAAIAAVAKARGA